MGKEDYRFAARDGKTTLYKFRAYGTEELRRRVNEILVDHKVYFSRASQLNDPFDLSPRFKRTTREVLMAAAKRFYERNPDNERENQTMRYLTTCDLSEQLADASARSHKRIQDDYLVFSLAGNRDHPMLWSHYAAGHTGLCIHFRSDAASILGAAEAVRYSTERPMLPMELDTLSPREIYERVALTKGEFWKYEEEYRWIRFPDTDWSDVPISFSGQHAHIRSSEVSGITVGARMPDSDIAKILALATRRTPRLPVWRAVEQDTFDFNFEQIG